MFELQSEERWLFPLIYVLWIFSIAGVVILSLQPATKLPVDFWNADKIGHLLAYLWLALLPTLVFKSTKGMILLSLGMVFLGIILEIGQMHIPGRMFSLADMGANTSGVSWVSPWASTVVSDFGD